MAIINCCSAQSLFLLSSLFHFYFFSLLLPSLTHTIGSYHVFIFSSFCLLFSFFLRYSCANATTYSSVTFFFTAYFFLLKRVVLCWLWSKKTQKLRKILRMRGTESATLREEEIEAEREKSINEGKENETKNWEEEEEVKKGKRDQNFWIEKKNRVKKGKGRFLVFRKINEVRIVERPSQRFSGSREEGKRERDTMGRLKWMGGG